MTYIRADGFSQGGKRPGSRVDVVRLRDQMVCDQSVQNACSEHAQN